MNDRAPRWKIWLCCLGLAPLAEMLVEVEWTYPLCPTDGVPAVMGFPFPYMRWSMVSSMEYDVVLSLYALDVICFAVALAALLGPLLRRLPQRLLSWVGLLSGTVLVLTQLSLILSIQIQHWRPGSIEHLVFKPDRYTDLRPVGLYPTFDYNCTPSAYWFPG